MFIDTSIIPLALVSILRIGNMREAFIKRFMQYRVCDVHLSSVVRFRIRTEPHSWRGHPELSCSLLVFASPPLADLANGGCALWHSDRAVGTNDVASGQRHYMHYKLTGIGPASSSAYSPSFFSSISNHGVF